MMASGVVRWFDTAKGYWFIAPDEGGADVFVHASVVELAGLREFGDGARVGFDRIEGRDGRVMAGNLRQA